MIRCRRLTRTYASEGQPVPAVRGVDLDVAAGEFLAITGASGSGKSTLLNLIGSLDAPDSGEIEVAGLALHRATEAEKTRFRRRDLGIVFQSFNLMPTMTVEENIRLPWLLRGDDPKSRELAERVGELLGLVGLQERRRHYPHQLSGGEMQRVAFARALVHRPALVIADEPTGNLDSRNRDRIIETLGAIHRDGLATLVVVTHEEAVAAAASRRIMMADGQIVEGSGGR
jgi:putative ABC transport system ATP-binding protein